MASLLEGSLAATVGKAAGFLFLDAVLERDVPGISADPADPVAPTPIQFTCKAIEEKYGTGTLAAGLVSASEVPILILASTLATTPRPLDRITIRSARYVVVPDDTPGVRAVSSDPARATWSCRCRS